MHSASHGGGGAGGAGGAGGGTGGGGAVSGAVIWAGAETLGAVLVLRPRAILRALSRSCRVLRDAGLLLIDFWFHLVDDPSGCDGSGGNGVGGMGGMGSGSQPGLGDMLEGRDGAWRTASRAQLVAAVLSLAALTMLGMLALNAVRVMHAVSFEFLSVA